MFSYEIYKIVKNTYFVEHLRTIAREYFKVFTFKQMHWKIFCFIIRTKVFIANSRKPVYFKLLPVRQTTHS